SRSAIAEWAAVFVSEIQLERNSLTPSGAPLRVGDDCVSWSRLEIGYRATACQQSIPLATTLGSSPFGHDFSCRERLRGSEAGVNVAGDEHILLGRAEWLDSGP